MKKFLAGIGGLIGLCGLCCVLPPLFVTLAGITGIGLGFWKWGFLLIVAALVVYIFTKKKRTCSKEKGCNCSSGACTR
ncbi:hypothetical protein Q9R38_14360 [Priestia aryabhattai]|uniref:hypothetical protein n=1 Tax=Priestia aryabhattai TaxID=412384 RepID=UPI0028827B31|nr:hypothetical protein [Priestia aryabhattai]MDT0147697.1 hypothetical protein [Priestia aryabhattai]MDT0154436.1 hypothetical protein [Priestia aryabhattai]